MSNPPVRQALFYRMSIMTYTCLLETSSLVKLEVRVFSNIIQHVVVTLTCRLNQTINNVCNRMTVIPDEPTGVFIKLEEIVFLDIGEVLIIDRIVDILKHIVVVRCDIDVSFE